MKNLSSLTVILAVVVTVVFVIKMFPSEEISLNDPSPQTGPNPQTYVDHVAHKICKNAGLHTVFHFEKVGDDQLLAISCGNKINPDDPHQP